MKNLSKTIKKLLLKYKSFLSYGSISAFVTIFDIAVCRLCERFASPVVANTIGVITGFVIQYFLTARHVYHTKSIKSFCIFLATFFLNLTMANCLVYVCRTFVFNNSASSTAFLISKSVSIVLPFFITYFIRKRIMPTKKENNDE